jgi:GAF domain-containing protein
MTDTVDFVTRASQHLLDRGLNPEAIQAALGMLGEGARVDRVYVFEDHLDEDSGARLTSQRFEWVAPGIVPQIDDPACQNLPYASIGVERGAALQRGEVVAALTRETEPRELREILEAQNIQSLLLCPIVFNLKTWGFVGFDDCHRERRWPPSEVSALRTFARALTAALRNARLQGADAMAQAKTELRTIAGTR